MGALFLFAMASVMAFVIYACLVVGATLYYMVQGSLPFDALMEGNDRIMEVMEDLFDRIERRIS